MSLQALAQKLEKRLLSPMPGAEAHEPLRAYAVGNLRPKFEHKLPPKPGSVLILLYEEDNVIKFPLTKRPEYLGAHGGQISLPGGKAEPGEAVEQTALREGQEEIGIVPDDVTILGKLSDFFVIPSNFIVTPIVAFASNVPAFRPDPREVERIITGNLPDLTADNAVKEKEILASNQFRMMAPHFEIGGEIVWGATAMMLNEFRILLREII